MAKKPPARQNTELPPHPLAGYYRDNTGKLYYVPSKPTFALYRLNNDFQPVDPDSPVQDDVEHFEKQLRYHTFTRINH